MNWVAVDGAFEVLQEDEHGKAVRFESTGNVVIVPTGEQIYDRIKRRKAKDPLACYLMATFMEGQEVKGLGKIVDVVRENLILLDTGRIVGSDLRLRTGVTVRSCKGMSTRKDPAYEKWMRLQVVCKAWEDFHTFREWYDSNRPKDRWSCLRTATGRWAPGECGFDTRCDLPVSVEQLRGGIFVR